MPLDNFLASIISHLPQMPPAVAIIIQIFFCLLIADFIAGFIHWLEDTYGDPQWPFIGRYIIRPNIVHHYDPRHFVRNNDWFGRMRVSAIILIVVVGLASMFHMLSWQLLLIFAIASQANEVHRWSHCSSLENGAIITTLQRWGLVQNPRQHAEHHCNDKNTNYCTITNLVNPILEKIAFWRTLESLIFRLSGIATRLDPSVVMHEEQKIILKAKHNWQKQIQTAHPSNSAEVC